jgi:hypothetical protein
MIEDKLQRPGLKQPQRHFGYQSKEGEEHQPAILP